MKVLRHTRSQNHVERESRAIARGTTTNVSPAFYVLYFPIGCEFPPVEDTSWCFALYFIFLRQVETAAIPKTTRWSYLICEARILRRSDYLTCPVIQAPPRNSLARIEYGTFLQGEINSLLASAVWNFSHDFTDAASQTRGKFDVNR